MNQHESEQQETVERYVRHRLAADERRAFQEHFFACDECFEQVQTTARFVAGVREASRSGMLAAEQPGRPRPASRPLPAFLKQGWLSQWAMPAVAASLLVALALVSLWALSLRRQNQQLAEQTAGQKAEQTAEQGRASKRLRSLEAKVQELEAGDSGASQEEKEALRREISRLKEQLAATERGRKTHLAQSRRLEVNVPVRNIYPVGDAQRSGGGGDINQLRVPRGARAFVLIFGDYKPGYPNYRLEILDSGGRVVARQAGLRPGPDSDLSVMLNRTLLSRGKYRLKLYGRREQVAEYLVQIE